MVFGRKGYTTLGTGDDAPAMPIDVTTTPRTNKMKRAGVIAGAILGAMTLYYAGCTVNIPPGEFGVRQVHNNLGGMLGSRGIRPGILGTGVHRQIPGLEQLLIVPKDTQVLNMSRKELLEKYTRGTAAANIQTSDGFYVDLDVSILYHITDPFKLITTIGAGNMYEDNGIIRFSAPTLRRVLGQLEPEDFYNVSKRVAQQEFAAKELSAMLEPHGMMVDHVLIRYPQFNAEVQTRIESRKVQDQLVHTRKAQAAAEEAQATFRKIKEEGVQAVTVKEMEGTAYTTQLQGKIDAYVTLKDSEIEKATQVAEAERTRLTNKAYEGAGSDLLVALRRAENMKNLRYILMPPAGQGGINPYHAGASTPGQSK